jgi:oxygen-independent coproporphyrinogen-3 oxidase
LDTALCGFGRCPELTVEAGRPDSIGPGQAVGHPPGGRDAHLHHPQTMNDQTLAAIGRSHSTRPSMRPLPWRARRDLTNINADIIAALPGEDLADFTHTLEQIALFGARKPDHPYAGHTSALPPP